MESTPSWRFLDEKTSSNVSGTRQMHWNSVQALVCMDCNSDEESYLESLQLLNKWTAGARTLGLLAHLIFNSGTPYNKILGQDLCLIAAGVDL